MKPNALQYSLFDDAAPVSSEAEDPIEVYRRIARERGGECLSDSYTNTVTPLRFRCEHGHEWTTTPASIKYAKTWCPFCCGNIPIDPLGRLNEIAASKGGECLSTVYINRRAKLSFRCIDGHEWNASPGDILSGKWCPDCRNKTEALVRQFFMCVFNAPFPSMSPSWLKVSGSPKRVLDGYNEALALAFEYDGIQHRRHVKHFHERSASKTFLTQQDRDSFVRNACARNGVVLVNIPDLADGYSIPMFVEHVSKAISKATGQPIENDAVQTFLRMPAGVSKLRELQNIANTKGGQCLETKYVSNITKMRFRCGNGHEFRAIPKTVRKGHWCPFCTRHQLIDALGELRDIAHLKGGEVVSTEYVSSVKKMRFRCANGHEWDAQPYMIRSGTWCAICAGLRVENPLGTVQRIAQSKGGECLSWSYVNSKSKLHFRCGKGHEWHATYGMIKRGTWCPYCYGNVLTDPLADMRRIAKEKGGECLSVDYINTTSRLRFRCAQGHEWETAHAVIKRGAWCPYCAGLRIEDPLGDLQSLAARKGGICLADKYSGSVSKLLFQCSEGHQWETTPNSVKTGHWCPRCASLNRAERTAATKEAKKTPHLPAD